MNGIKVATVEDAWKVAKLKFPTSFTHDPDASERAGYPIYVSLCGDYPNCSISDLGTRLEINLNAETVNIWIEDEKISGVLRSIENEYRNSYLEASLFAIRFAKDCKSDEALIAKAKHEAILEVMEKLNIDYK